MVARPPSLRAVSAFEAAARHQSFSRAAEELALTHGAISHAIRGLEARLNVQLFERHGRGVSLTEPGRVFAGRVRLSLGLLAEAFETRPWVEGTRLTVSVLPSFGMRVLAPRLADFQVRHPEISLVLRAGWALADLTDGAVDVGLRYGPGGWVGVSAVRLAKETLFPVASPAVAGGLRTPGDLADRELLGHPEFPWAPWFAAAGLDWPEPRPRLTIDESVLLLDAAAAGAGVALARSMLVEADLASGRLVRPFAVEVASDYAYWFVWDPASPKQAAIGAFRDWLAASITA